ncbi:MAG: hypothetical protein PHY88_00440 [Candidatus Omnitrophica bacterium]|nr:hypothetical protein [Candidatus Omnitrophota bacterium]
MKTITIIQNGQPKEVEVWLDDKVSARKEFQFFFSHLNYAVNFFDKYMLALVCFERAYPGARLHIHALIQGISPCLCRMLQSECFEFFGESEVKPYEPFKGVSFYFGWKYLKPELVDFDFLRINARRRKGALNGNTQRTEK